MPQTRQGIAQVQCDKVWDGWKEIGRWFGYSPQHIRALWRRCKFRLKHRLHDNSRVRMTEEELQRFKRLIQNLVK